MAMHRADFKWPVISISICAAIAFVVSRFSRLPFGWAFALVALAMFVNGLVATYEDDIPGGFNNPDGRSTPRYVGIVDRILYWLLLGGAISLAVYSLAFARDVIVGGISLGLVAGIAGWTILVKRRRK